MLKGRHCVICKKAGGTGFTYALNLLGIKGVDLKAHPNCVQKLKQKVSQ